MNLTFYIRFDDEIKEFRNFGLVLQFFVISSILIPQRKSYKYKTNGQVDNVQLFHKYSNKE